MDILRQIVDEKCREVATLRERTTISSLRDAAAKAPWQPRGFVQQLTAVPFPAVIAEIKRASPSKGVFNEKLDAVDTAKSYEAAGAACLSVLTDEKFFCGSLKYLSLIRNAGVNIPMLRKDFIIDPLQIWEARVAGADAVLLIAAILDDVTLANLLDEALQASLDVIIEVHSAEELGRVLATLNDIPAVVVRDRLLLGINNRNLKTFETDLSVTETLVADLPESAPRVVSESGFFEAAELHRMYRSGVTHFLIGESLVTSGEPGEMLKALLDAARGKVF